MVEIIDEFSAKGCLPAPFLSSQTMLDSGVHCRQKEKALCFYSPVVLVIKSFGGGGLQQLLSFFAPLVTAFSVKCLLFLLSLLIFIGIWHLKIPGCLQTNAC